ncbi:MAG: hypothetical protein DMG16_03265 [Acidobacteria bacterium]|nr:MAG: hypothetical protein DMG16_03265 [Acidobacteriota bacterium]
MLGPDFNGFLNPVREILLDVRINIPARRVGWIVRPKNAPAPRKILSSRPDSGIPSLRSRNSRIGQGGKTAFIFPSAAGGRNQA